MQVTEKSSEGLKRAFAVVLPAADLAARREARLAEIGRELRLPGFRPGKVPPKIVAQRYGQAVMGEVLERSLDDAARRIVTDRGLRPAAQPKVEIVNWSEGADLEFNLDVELLPEITVPDLAAIEVEKLTAAPSEEEVTKRLEEIARRHRNSEPVEETRPAAAGDLLVVDFTGRIDGRAFRGGSATDMEVEVAGAGFVPGFTEGLVGLAPGETREVSVTFPEGYPAEDLAGKTAVFTVTAKALRRALPPSIDDALATKHGFADLNAMREAIRGAIQREYDQLARLRLKRALLDRLAEQAAFPAPESMVEAEFGAIWQRIEQDMKAGRLDEADRDKDEATLKAEYRAIAERRVRLGLLLSEIGRANNLTVSQEELRRAIIAEAQRYPGQERKVLEFYQQNPQAVERFRAPIFEEKVIDYVLALAKVSERLVSPEELARDPDAAS
ncbi:trigger factor [Elioraea sp. Yellowstone]|jgi:trigger factor|uniref:trigger factor n=1 Tax=Elioraea sp. Yellowstone TaxID=2592070 RepID=UPI001153972E|nr:trigger factor [Elioraea sp. Yellowstone]TQF85701.1 trigger factor [Elioraea sp. Yellowstone]